VDHQFGFPQPRFSILAVASWVREKSGVGYRPRDPTILHSSGGPLDTKRMLAEVEAEITKLEHVADALRGSTSKRSRPRGKRKTMSAAARRKISLAQRARWSKLKSGAQPTKPKRAVSAASRRKMAAAQRRRWSMVKAKA
jgi:hypothetical protein